MITTLNDVKSVFLSHPHSLTPWNILLKSLNKMEADDEPLDLMHVLETVGVKCSIWCLASFSYKDYCLFLADVAESVLHIFEAVYSDNKAPREAIQAIRDYHSGAITQEQLYNYANATKAMVKFAIYYAESEKWDEIRQLFIKHFSN